MAFWTKSVFYCIKRVDPFLCKTSAHRPLFSLSNSPRSPFHRVTMAKIAYIRFSKRQIACKFRHTLSRRFLTDRGVWLSKTGTPERKPS